MAIKNENYIQISGWMINELELKGNELLVYALIHGFCQDGKSVFNGSLNYIMAWFNISKPTCIATVQSLITKKLIIKKIIYHKNSIAGCEYFTTRSRGTELSETNVAIEDKRGGKEILPPQDKEAAVGGKKILPGWSKNLTRGGQISLPNNTNNNKDNATVARLADKYFGVNAFDERFPQKAAAFLSKQDIKDYDLYFDFILTKVKKKQSDKQIQNPRGLAYRLFFQSDIAQEFIDTQNQTAMEAKKAQLLDERKIVCPCCGSRFLPDYKDNCPECNFEISRFKDSVKVSIHRKLLALPEDQRMSYEKELCKIYLDRNFLERMNMTGEQKARDRARREELETRLNIKYGLAG